MQKLKTFFSKLRTAPPSPVAEPEIQPPEPPPLTERETAAATAPPVSPLPSNEDTPIIPEPLEEPPAPVQETPKEPPKTKAIAPRTDSLPDYIRVQPTLETSGCFPATKERIFRTGEDAIRVVNLPHGGRIKYVPSAGYGDLNAFDFDVYRAVQAEAFDQCEKIEVVDPETGKTEMHYKLPHFIATSTSKLLKLAGKRKSGKDTKHKTDGSFEGVKKSLKRQQFFGVEGKAWLNSKGSYVELSGTIFPKILTKGEIQEDGTETDKHYIWLSEWFASSFNQGHHKLLDISVHRQLSKPVAKVLYPLLEQGFFAASKRGGSYWEKSYLDLCREQLFVEPRSSLSLVKQQLDPAHKQLQQLGIISNWEYRQSSDVWLVIRYYPGDKFHSDQKERKRRTQTVKQLETRRPRKRGKLSQQEEMLVQRAVELGNDPDNIRIYQNAIRTHGASIFEAGLGDAKDIILRSANTGTRGACIIDCINRVAQARRQALQTA